jgi:uncharacterized protein (TIGR00296 family)
MFKSTKQVANNNDTNNNIIVIIQFSPTKNIQNQLSSGDDAQCDISEKSLVATQAMCIHCFNVVIHHLFHDGAILQPSLLDDIKPETECPLFVTWEKTQSSSSSSSSSSSGYRLRGCIGTLSPRPLKQALSDYATISAFRDHRFHPIAKNEVCHLRVGVSLLVKYEICNDCLDWEVGTHGIIIKFYYDGKHYNGEICFMDACCDCELYYCE